MLSVFAVSACGMRHQSSKGCKLVFENYQYRMLCNNNDIDDNNNTWCQKAVLNTILISILATVSH